MEEGGIEREHGVVHMYVATYIVSGNLGDGKKLYLRGESFPISLLDLVFWSRSIGLDLPFLRLGLRKFSLLIW